MRTRRYDGDSFRASHRGPGPFLGRTGPHQSRLIPRVIRQHELFAQHIAEHENLPEVAGRAISEALAAAREEQQRQFSEALDAARTELDEEAETRLRQALSDLQSALVTARSELSEQSNSALSQALADLQAALESHRNTLVEQSQSSLQNALSTLQQDARKTRNLLIGITAGAVAVSIAAVVIAIVAG